MVMEVGLAVAPLFLPRRVRGLLAARPARRRAARQGPPSISECRPQQRDLFCAVTQDVDAFFVV